ncbi:hypothetical protein THAOC_18331, partial [Thalassiosira oceanica]
AAETCAREGYLHGGQWTIIKSIQAKTSLSLSLRPVKDSNVEEPFSTQKYYFGNLGWILVVFWNPSVRCRRVVASWAQGAFGQEAREDPAYLLREAEKKAKKREDSDVRDKENAQKRARRAEDGGYRDALQVRDVNRKRSTISYMPRYPRNHSAFRSSGRMAKLLSAARDISAAAT